VKRNLKDSYKLFISFNTIRSNFFISKDDKSMTNSSRISLVEMDIFEILVIQKFLSLNPRNPYKLGFLGPKKSEEKPKRFIEKPNKPTPLGVSETQGFLDKNS